MDPWDPRNLEGGDGDEPDDEPDDAPARLHLVGGSSTEGWRETQTKNFERGDAYLAMVGTAPPQWATTPDCPEEMRIGATSASPTFIDMEHRGIGLWTPRCVLYGSRWVHLYIHEGLVTDESDREVLGLREIGNQHVFESPRPNWNNKMQRVDEFPEEMYETVWEMALDPAVKLAAPTLATKLGMDREFASGLLKTIADGCEIVRSCHTLVVQSDRDGVGEDGYTVYVSYNNLTEPTRKLLREKRQTERVQEVRPVRTSEDGSVVYTTDWPLAPVVEEAADDQGDQGDQEAG